MIIKGLQTFDDKGQEIWLHGTVDACVMPWFLEGKLGPNRVIPGSAGYDPTTTLQASSIRELAWRIMWGLLRFKKDPESKKEKSCLRTLVHDSWGTLTCMEGHEKQALKFYEMLDAFTEMAGQTDSYLVLTLSGFAEPTINSTTVQLFTIGSPFYQRFVLYAADVINRYAPCGRVLFEVSNEPDNETYVKVWGADVAARKLRYIAWERQIIKDIMALVTVPNVIIGMGHALGGTMFGYDWDSGTFVKDANAPEELKFSSGHWYWFGASQADIAWQYGRIKGFADTLNKPLLWGEHGDLRTGAAWFVQWIDDLLASLGVHNTSMRLAAESGRALFPIPAGYVWPAVPAPPVVEIPIDPPPSTDTPPTQEVPEEPAEEPADDEPGTDPPKEEEPEQPKPEQPKEEKTTLLVWLVNKIIELLGRWRR